MTARKWRLANSQALNEFMHFAMDAIKRKPIVVQIVPEKRSLDQNSLIHALYKQVSDQREDMSVEDVRHLCKLEIGVPILRSEDPEFAAFYDKAIKHTLTYEEKLAAMKFTPVTSRMGKKQAGDFINQFLRYWSEQGVFIVMPGDGYEQAA